MLRKIFKPEGADKNDRLIVIGLTHAEIDTLKEPDQAIELNDSSSGIRVVLYSEETEDKINATFLKLIGDNGSNE